jgi:hypothetical protein
VILSLAGCASSSTGRGNETFDTFTSAEGKRQFRYSFVVPRPRDCSSNRQAQQQRGSSDPWTSGPCGGPDPSRMEELLRPHMFDRLFEVLEENQYCPGGYTELESRFDFSSFIVGECVGD